MFQIYVLVMLFIALFVYKISFSDCSRWKERKWIYMKYYLFQYISRCFENKDHL